MEGCSFEKQKLPGCSFPRSNLSSCYFANCDLSSLKLTDINLEKAIFDFCKLTNTDFSGSVTTGVSFQNCRISHTTLDLEGFIQFGLSKGFVLQKS